MEEHVNSHNLILAGENSFIHLSESNGDDASTRLSHWRVLWSRAGDGHALFVDSPVTDGVCIYSDNPQLARFLQREIECLLYKPFSDPSVAVVPASFERQGLPPDEASELVGCEVGKVRITWSEFMDPFNFAADPGYDGRPLGVQTTFFPAKSATFSVDDRLAAGKPWPLARGGRPCSSACLAWCETWFRPSEDGPG